MGKVFVGSKVSSTWSGSEVQLFTDAEFSSRFGRSFDNARDFVGVMNSDYAANGTYLDSTVYSASSKKIWTRSPSGNTGGQIRLNYLVVLGE